MHRICWMRMFGAFLSLTRIEIVYAQLLVLAVMMPSGCCSAQSHQAGIDSAGRAADHDFSAALSDYRKNESRFGFGFSTISATSILLPKSAEKVITRGRSVLPMLEEYHDSPDRPARVLANACKQIILGQVVQKIEGKDPESSLDEVNYTIKLNLSQPIDR